MAPAVLAELAFVTFLSGGAYHGHSYADNVVNWVKQLRCHNVTDANIVVLIADSTSPADRVAVSRLGVKVKHVPTLTTRGAGHPRFSTMVTKVWLWSLVRWKRVVYFDSDFFFLRPPWPCATGCPANAELCAVADPAAMQGPSYFNAGFLVLKPSLETFRWLKRNVGRASNREFAEQDMMNDLFKDRVAFMGKECNFLHAPEDYREVASSRSVIAVHEKMALMRDLIPRGHFLRTCILELNG